MIKAVYKCLIVIVLVSFSSLAVAQNKADYANLNLDKLWAQYGGMEKAPQLNDIYPYQHCFERTSHRYSIPLGLLLAVARGESNFNSRAVSSANAVGLMQILWPITARHLGIERKSKLFEPCINVDAGGRYLRQMLARYKGNIHRALGAYNYGPARVPVDSSALPAGAHWYSGYIYQHLLHVTRGGEIPRNTQPLLSFSTSSRAEAFIAKINQQQPTVKLTWSKLGRKRFRVALLFKNKQELSTGLASLAKAGFLLSGS